MRMERSFAALLLALAIPAGGCGSAKIDHGNTGNGPTTTPTGSGGSGGSGSGGNGSGGSGGTAPCTPGDQNTDADGDGYTPAQGDCNDCDPTVNPGAIEVAANGQDDDCNGQVDEAAATCDSANGGMNDAASFAQAMELCDPRFLKNAPSPAPRTRARASSPRSSAPWSRRSAGANMAYISTGLAVDESSSGFVEPQDGHGSREHRHQSAAEPGRRVELRPGAARSPTSTTTPRWSSRSRRRPTRSRSRSTSTSSRRSIRSSSAPSSTTSSSWSCSRRRPTRSRRTSRSTPARTRSPSTAASSPSATRQHAADEALHQPPSTDNEGTGFDDKQGSQPTGGSTGWLTTTAPVARRRGHHAALRHLRRGRQHLRLVGADRQLPVGRDVGHRADDGTDRQADALDSRARGQPHCPDSARPIIDGR